MTNKATNNGGSVIYKFIALLLCTWLTFTAHAETVASFWKGQQLSNNTPTGNFYTGTSAAEVGAQQCAFNATSLGLGGSFTAWNSNYVRADCDFQPNWGYASGGNLFQACPPGGESTGDMPNMQCFFPTPCAPGQTRNQFTGVCAAAPQQACPTGQFTSGLYQGQPSATACAPNGCMVIFQGTYPTHKDAQGNLYASGAYNYEGVGNQGSCTPGVVTATTTATPSTTAPPCAPNEGVMTSSSGTVACVPSSTPGAQTPKVTSTTETKTASDGSTKSTTTTNTCTGAGSCASTSTTTTTGVGGAPGGAAGQSGTPGVETAKKDEAGDDFCAKNASLQICKGGLNEEATQKKIADALGTTGVNNDAINNATASDADKTLAQNAYDASIVEMNKIGGAGDAASGNQNSFRDVLSNWFEPIPITGCTPFSGTIGGRVWNLDPCPTATKISDIAAYCLWVMFAFGVFSLVTRRAE